MQEHDVVVVGGGHNGLIAACYMAKAGFDVCVVESTDHLGGGVVTQELTLPGFKHDRGSTVHGMIQGNPLMINDELGLKSKYGLEYLYSEGQFATVFKDGTSICHYTSLDRTCESIAKVSPEDAENYRNFVNALMPASSFINSGSFNAPPSFGNMVAQLDASPVGRDVISSMFMSCWDVVQKWFKSPKVQTHIMNMTTDMFCSPEDKGTAFFLYMLVPGSHAAPWAVPKGGSGELTRALAECFEDNGGTILLNADVTRIPVSGDRATGVVLASGEEIKARKAVVSSINAAFLFGKNGMVGEGYVSPAAETRLANMTYPQIGGPMIHCALDGKPKWKAGDHLDEMIMIEPAPDLEGFRKWYDDLRYGRLPKELNSMACIMSLIDPSRAPEGKHVLYLSHGGPIQLAGHDRSYWDEAGQQHVNDAIRLMDDYIEGGLSPLILKTHYDTTYDWESIDKNFIMGSCLGPAMSVDQMFTNRPCAELGHFKTPVDGLWLCGMSSHPGGGVTGGSRAMVPLLLEELGSDIEDII